MILFEGVNGCLETAEYLRNLRVLLRRQFIHVFVNGFAWINLVLNAVQSGQEQRGESNVRVRRRIRRTIFEALGLGIVAVGRDANGGAAVARAVSEVDRRFKAGHKPFVTVGRGTTEGAQGVRVFEQAADV